MLIPTMSLLLLVKSWVTSLSRDSWIVCEFPRMLRLQMIATTCKTCSLTYFWILQVQRDTTTDSVKDNSSTSAADYLIQVHNENQTSEILSIYKFLFHFVSFRFDSLRFVSFRFISCETFMPEHNLLKLSKKTLSPRSQFFLDCAPQTKLLYSLPMFMSHKCQQKWSQGFNVCFVKNCPLTKDGFFDRWSSLKQHIVIPALFCTRKKADFYF